MPAVKPVKSEISEESILKFDEIRENIFNKIKSGKEDFDKFTKQIFKSLTDDHRTINDDVNKL